MNNKKGFTLIEVLAVIAIIGVIMLIAIPNVSQYVLGSRKSSFAGNAHAYIETARAEYEGKDYGPFLEDDEIMIVPIAVIQLDKNDSGSSPFGEYDFDRSYILIVPERNAFEYYATIKDVKNNAVVMRPYNELDRDVVEDNVTNIDKWSKYAGTNNAFVFNNKNYIWCESRESKAVMTSEYPILVLCEE